MVFEHDSPRTFLKAVLLERIQKNPRYSLRGMAKQVGLSPSSLSDVLKGKKRLSVLSASRVAEKLGLRAREREYLILLVQLDKAAPQESREMFLRRLRQLNPKRPVHDVSLDSFRAISEWFHLPMLELSRIEGFDLEPRTISRALGISIPEAEAGLDRLIRLGHLIKNPDGTWQKSLNHWVASSRDPHEALRKFYRQMLDRASESLEAVRPTERVTGSETFPMDSSLIEEARELSEEFFSRLVELSARSSKRDTVFHAALHLFPVTRRTQ